MGATLARPAHPGRAPGRDRQLPRTPDAHRRRGPDRRDRGPRHRCRQRRRRLIVAIPEKSIPELPAGLLSALPEATVVIDAGNYVPKLRDGHIDAIDAGLPESQWVQSQLGHPVVKAFNTIRPASLASRGKPAGARRARTAIPVAGDDPAAKSVVLELANQLGFDGLDAGPSPGHGASSPAPPSTPPTCPRRRPAGTGGRGPGAGRQLAQRTPSRRGSTPARQA